jgi:hypothetical protein
LIVISGALVLVAAVLLVLGIVSSITLVYAAIGLSLVSAVFLLVGVFQRPVLVSERASSDEDAPTRAAPAVQMSKPKEPARVATVEPEPEAEYADESADVDTAADYPMEAANADFEQRAEATGADVLVISGRPRYHVGGCEYVEGHEESEPLDIVEARELGFTPCGACRPNETLALGAAGHDSAAAPAASPAASPAEPAPIPVASAHPAIAVPVAGAVHDPGSNGGSLAAVNGVNPVEPVTAEQPAVVASVPVSQPFVAAAPPVAQPVAEPVAQPVAEPPVAAAMAAESEPAAPATAATAASARPRVGAPTVLAVTLSKEYHRSGCVLLEGVNADELTKAAAIRQGFLACGVCKP